MIKTLSPYSKTAEIMSRYRPIAPKPASSGGDGEPVMSNKISQSPYLRNIWPQLQARPTRTRKRGRTSTLSPPSALMKRQRPVHHPSHLAFSASPARSLSLHGFVHAQAQAHGLSRLHVPSLALGCSLETTRVTLPLLPCKPMGSVASLTEVEYLKPNERAIDLNTVATHEVPVEKDFLQQLQRPPSPPPLTASGVIAPQPIRPVGSVIRVERINSITGEDFTVTKATKTRQEVEEEAESEALPVVISDSHNKVRMANCAYKEMVGQPECPWLDRMVSSGKRISGEVMLQFLDSDFKVPVSSTGFSCWVKIEWGNEGKKSCAHAFCDVIRLSSETKDYEFAWRFRIQTREAASPSCSNA